MQKMKNRKDTRDAARAAIGRSRDRNIAAGRNEDRAAKRAAAQEQVRILHGEEADQIDRLLHEITQAMKARRQIENPNWGHIGDLRHYEQKLTDIADSLLKRGEYA